MPTPCSRHSGALVADRAPSPIPGQVVDTRSDGTVVVFDGYAPDGQEWGHIEGPTGRAYPGRSIINLFKFNTWTGADPRTPQFRPPMALPTLGSDTPPNGDQ